MSGSTWQRRRTIDPEDKQHRIKRKCGTQSDHGGQVPARATNDEQHPSAAELPVEHHHHAHVRVVSNGSPA